MNIYINSQENKISLELNIFNKQNYINVMRKIKKQKFLLEKNIII